MLVLTVLFINWLLSSVVASRYPDLTHAEDVQIVYPEISSRGRTRRSADDDLQMTETKVMRLGNWFVELDLSDNSVVAPDLKAEWINLDGSSRELSLPKCHYRTGVVKGLEDKSRVALGECGNSFTAFVDVRGLSYFLEPLNSSNGAHIMYTSRGNHRRVVRSSNEGYFMPEVPTTKQWLFNLTGDTLDFGKEKSHNGNEENDLDNDGNPDGADDTGDGFSRDGNITSERRRYREQILEVDKDGYFLDSAWTADVMQERKKSGKKLQQRWMEIAVAVDHTLISFHGRDKVEQYVLSLMNIVSAIYQDPSLEANLRLVVTRLLLYEHKKHGIVRPGHSKKSLSNVNSWNKRLHDALSSGDSEHDVAVWLTRSDIGGPSGYAPVAGVCDPKRSCALTRDEGLTSAFIIAHETAHILGLTHDGDVKNGNKCEDEAMEGSIMAPMVSATFNKFSWSDCSRKEFRKNIKKWKCLLNQPSGSKEIALNATLQTSFSMDEQCRMEFGEGYGKCRAFEIIEPCSHLWCGHEDSPLVCKTKKGPPLEGTECGFGKWCVNGYCEDISQRIDRIPIVLNPQDGGWGQWGPWGPCSRSCGIGVQFRSRGCDNPEPSYGGKQCTGEREEWRVCNENECPEPLVDIRAQQCKQLPKLFDLKGKFDDDFTWLPYESDDDKKKCKFICINADKKELYSTEENLLDGTPCSYEDSDSICVQGKCQEIGCDGNLNSKLRRDRCGICGGNNSECSEMNKSFDRKLKKEISRVTVLPRMARQINVEVNVTVSRSEKPVVALILKNRRKKRFTVTIPNTVIHTKILEGARFSYNKIDNKHMIWSKGPLHSEMVVLIVVPEKELKYGTNITYRTAYSIQKDYLKPSKRYVWIMGGWGPCSMSCGGGIRRKTTACWDNLNKKIVRRNYCSLLQKPKLDVEKCNTFGCHFQWITGSWEPCTTSCGSRGVQSREIYCIPNSVLNTMLFKFNGTITNPWTYMVNPNKCSGIRPTTMRNCNRKTCPAYPVMSEWSQCSSSCGTGLQTRTSYCPNEDGNEPLDCGILPGIEKRQCYGNSTRQMCKDKRQQCNGDHSQYCSISLLHRYCLINGFRRMCCRTCKNYQSLEI